MNRILKIYWVRKNHPSLKDTSIKASKKRKEVDDQKEFAFVDKDDDRGYFVDSSGLVQRQNLDQPYLPEKNYVKFK